MEHDSRPFVVTDFQSISARSVIPIQDTPAIKMTYDAEIIVPNSFFVRMSATRLSETKFQQKVRVPSYLIAFVVAPKTSVELE
jgi:leukotriene-A4 hydrolase